MLALLIEGRVEDYIFLFFFSLIGLTIGLFLSYITSSYFSKEFLGEIFQKPPLFSAIKVKGERLYKKARRGEKVNVKTRKITIYNFEITEINIPKVKFKITCSKGTYIRSIANDFGLKLKNGGYLSELTREKIGNYSLNQSLTISEFEKNLMRDIS